MEDEKGSRKEMPMGFGMPFSSISLQLRAGAGSEVRLRMKGDICARASSGCICVYIYVIYRRESCAVCARASFVALFSCENIFRRQSRALVPIKREKFSRFLTVARLRSRRSINPRNDVYMCVYMCDSKRRVI